MSGAPVQWEMQTPKGWVDVPFKAPPGGASAGKSIQCVFQGAPLEVQFTSGTEASVKTKGKIFPARVKVSAAFSPPERVAGDAAKEAADASIQQMNPLLVFDAMATDGAVRPKEFATILQLEASAAMKMAAFQALGQAPAPPEVTDSIKPAINRAVQRLDFSHMRHLLEMLFRVMDGNKNGKIERAEFEGFFSGIMGMAADPMAAPDFAFSMIDKNGNGKLSLDEAQEVVDAVTELATTIIASIADVAEALVSDADVLRVVTDLAKMNAASQGMEDGTVMGVCCESGDDLEIGPNWYHVLGTDKDLSKEEYDKYEGEDKAQYIVIDSKEKLGADLEDYSCDFSNLVSRDKLAKQLEENGVLEMMAQIFADDGSQGPKAQLVNSMKAARQAFAQFESSTGAQFYMKAMEWSQGGVDEATFVSQVVPLLRENQKQQMDKMQADPAAMVQQQFDAMRDAGQPVPEQQQAMIAAGVEAVSGEFVPALKRAQERCSEYLPEYARALFRFLDIDGSGCITKKEIQLLKALLDALLHLGERACHDMSSGELRPMDGDYKDNAKELAFAIFDVLDRDGDQHLSFNEIIAFAQKTAIFSLSMIRIMAHMTIECVLDEFFKAFAEFGWKQAGLQEVEKEQFLPMLMMAPMAVQGMMQ